MREEEEEEEEAPIMREIASGRRPEIIYTPRRRQVNPGEEVMRMHGKISQASGFLRRLYVCV